MSEAQKNFVLLTCLIWGLLLSCASVAEVVGVTEYRLAAGDHVRITVFGHEDLSGEFEVDGTGLISLPLIREVMVSGLTVNELEEKVIGKLRPDYLKNPRVSVEILSYRPFYVIGEVESPGSFPYVNGMTVINAVAVAGGFTYRARKSRIKILRSGEDGKFEIEADVDTVVLPGDVIEVPERFF